MSASETLMARRKDIMEQYKAEIGAPFLAGNGAAQGVVTAISSRYCASCQRVCTCYIVRWEDDGKITKPCVRGVGYNADGILQIGV